MTDQKKKTHRYSFPVRKCKGKGCFAKPEKNGYCKECTEVKNGRPISG